MSDECCFGGGRPDYLLLKAGIEPQGMPGTGNESAETTSDRPTGTIWKKSQPGVSDIIRASSPIL